MQINLLGPFEARRDDASTAPCGGIKQRGVLAQLALEPNHPVALDRIAEGIWGTSVPPRYRQNVQTYVSTLRRALEPLRSASAPSRIVGHDEAYELVAGPDEVDVAAFRAGVEAGARALADGRPLAARTDLDQALDRWRGPALADLVALPFASDWLEYLQARQLAARELSIDARLALGEHLAVIEDLQVLVRDHPERERFWTQLVLAQVRGGRQVEGLATLRRARDLLVEEHGLDLGAELSELEQKILNQEPALLGTRTEVALGGSLPVALTPMLGRDELLALVVSALDEGQRLVTLTGPGGVGKTRLALAVAATTSARRETVWVPLADEQTSTDIAQAVADRLGHPVDGSGETLTDELVLVLDNLEHLADAPRAVRGLLERHRGVRVLATSRGPLGIPGEQVVRLPPLPVDDASRLFCDRARSILPSFEDDPEVVAELTQRLDGLPLAIELAAARINVLDPAELLRRLPAVGDLRDPSASSVRQSSVDEAVRWSVRLLDASALTTLHALAALDAAVDNATAGAAAAALDGHAHRVDDLEQLVRLGLVVPLEAASGRRFALLATVRAVVREDAAAGPAVARAVGAAWMRRDQDRDLVGDWSRQHLSRLSDDLPLLRQVTQAQIEAGEVAQAAELVLSQRRGLHQIGRDDDLRQLCATILAADPPEPWSARLEVMIGCATFSTYGADAGALLDSVERLDPSDSLFRVLGYAYRAALRSERGNASLARADAEAATEAAGTHRTLLQMAHSAASWVATERGDADDAVLHATQGLAAAGNALERTTAVTDLARAELMRGRVERAEELLVGALQDARRLGQYKALSDIQTNLGYALIRRGAAEDGLAMLADVLPAVARMSDLGWTLEVVTAIALAALTTVPDEPRAVDLLRAATTMTRAIDADGSPVPGPLLGLSEPWQAVLDDPGLAVPAPTALSLEESALELAASLRREAETEDHPDAG